MIQPSPGIQLQVQEAQGVKVRFWDATHPEEHRAWVDLWRRWPGREVWAHPDYVRLFARPGERALAAALETPRGGILFPIIVRPLEAEPWGAAETGLCDVTNAYGYGGPFAWGVEASEANEFHAQFEAGLRRLGAVTTFARLSLFEDEMLPFPGDRIDRGANIVRTLDRTPDELWADYEHKVRKNVQKARRDGLEIRFDQRGERLEEFLDIYIATMDRRNAQSSYYFPKSFFEALLGRLPGSVMFAHAVLGGKVVSTELLLLSSKTAYSYLGGTLAEAFGSRPNDLLKHECFVKCREMGLSRVVLGGSYAEGDGLLRYKKAFAPYGERRFRVGMTMHDAPAAARLTDARKAWERAQGREWEPAVGYFPAYRS